MTLRSHQRLKDRPTGTVILQPYQEGKIHNGHSWIYNTQIEKIKGECHPGDFVEVRSHRQEFLGCGYINPTANVTVRLLTTVDEPINREFFTRRVRHAITLRQRLMTDETTAYRLVFSAADFLPGLIVDKYGDYLVLQSITWGMDSRLALLSEIFGELLHPRGIYVRNDLPARLPEGLPLYKKILYGKFATKQRIRENGITFEVDLENGQKTGMYVDRRPARALLKGLAKGRSVLDCFCYNAPFAVSAMVDGAVQATGIDISAHALKGAVVNMQANRIHSGKYQFREGNAFDELKTLFRRKEQYGMVILDPPSFASAKMKIESGLRAYREINLRAMGILEDRGILVSSCCSPHVSQERFEQMLGESARDAKRLVRFLHKATQGPDHPQLLHRKETGYLKLIVAEILH